MSWFSKLRHNLSNAIVGVGQGTTPHQTLDNNPMAFRLFSVVAVIILAGSTWLVISRIQGATRPPLPANTNSVTAVAELNKLKAKDTDKDGLSDYDELFSTGTSPYLKDSDGDGISDYDEVKQGSDPNCPQGKVCSTFALLTSPLDANGNLTPAFLRQALKSAGVPQAQLDQTDDATLVKIYSQVAGTTSVPTNTNASTNTNVSTSSNTNSSISSLDQFDNLSPAEIRQLLIQNGVDQTTLSQVDDATLQQIFQQAAQSNQ